LVDDDSATGSTARRVASRKERRGIIERETSSLFGGNSKYLMWRMTVPLEGEEATMRVGKESILSFEETQSLNWEALGRMAVEGCMVCGELGEARELGDLARED
jgi:hypothetical protein